MFTSRITYIFCDAPEACNLSLQDVASPTMYGLIELHDYVLFYFVLILVAVSWIIIRDIVTYFMLRGSQIHFNVGNGLAIEFLWTLAPALIIGVLALPFLNSSHLFSEIYCDPNDSNDSNALGVPLRVDLETAMEEDLLLLDYLLEALPPETFSDASSINSDTSFISDDISDNYMEQVFLISRNNFLPDNIDGYTPELRNTLLGLNSLLELKVVVVHILDCPPSFSVLRGKNFIFHDFRTLLRYLNVDGHSFYDRFLSYDNIQAINNGRWQNLETIFSSSNGRNSCKISILDFGGLNELGLNDLSSVIIVPSLNSNQIN